MDNEKIPPQPENKTGQEPPSGKKFKFKYLFIFIGIFLAIALSAGAYFFGVNQAKNSLSGNSQKSGQQMAGQEKSSDGFFYFSIPKPVSKLTFTDLPNTVPNHAVRIGDSIWFSGTPSLIQYDIKSGKIAAYSNPKKAHCGSSIVYLNGYIYAACNIDNIEDAFGQARVLDTEIFTGHFGVLKIDPVNHKLIKTFSKEDGLLNGYNYVFYPDGDYIWIGTFDGVGRINTKTDKVDFYTTQMGFREVSNAISNNVYHIFVDKDYVWAWNIASVDSRGGIALFDKKTEKWTAFGPDKLKERDFSRIDLEAGKLIPGGIQIGFRDGQLNNQDRFVEMQYLYSSGEWKRVNTDMEATGEAYEKLTQYIKTEYPDFGNNYVPDLHKIDEYGLVQLKDKKTGQVYQLDGRTNYIMSPTISGKRYILTNATIDEISDSTDFRTILVKFDERLDTYMAGGGQDDYESLVKFFVDPGSLLALVLDSQCGGMLCGEGQIAWLADLKNKKIIKKFTKEDSLPGGDLFTQKLNFQKTGDVIHVTNGEGEPVFDLDTKTLKITDLSLSPTPFKP